MTKNVEDDLANDANDLQTEVDRLTRHSAELETHLKNLHSDYVLVPRALWPILKEYPMIISRARSTAIYLAPLEFYGQYAKLIHLWNDILV